MNDRIEGSNLGSSSETPGFLDRSLEELKGFVFGKRGLVRRELAKVLSGGLVIAGTFAGCDDGSESEAVAEIEMRDNGMRDSDMNDDDIYADLGMGDVVDDGDAGLQACHWNEPDVYICYDIEEVTDDGCYVYNDGRVIDCPPKLLEDAYVEPAEPNDWVSGYSDDASSGVSDFVPILPDFSLSDSDD